MKESKRRPWVKRRYRRAYTGSKRFDSSCRNHGGCKYCEHTRTHAVKRQIQNSQD